MRASSTPLRALQPDEGRPALGRPLCLSPRRSRVERGQTLPAGGGTVPLDEHTRVFAADRMPVLHLEPKSPGCRNTASSRRRDDQARRKPIESSPQGT
jgi:hypothetical protein